MSATKKYQTIEPMNMNSSPMSRKDSKMSNKDLKGIGNNGSPNKNHTKSKMTNF